MGKLEVVVSRRTRTTWAAARGTRTREGKDMGDDKELVEFYQAVMRRREQQGWD